MGTDSAARRWCADRAGRGRRAGHWRRISLRNCDSKTTEGEYWHAILHRQEPDAGNAAYWFRRVGQHPIFPKLAAEAKEILNLYPDSEFRVGRWDPFAFVHFCERARLQPGTTQEQAAVQIQRAEWQLLFDYSARPQ